MIDHGRINIHTYICVKAGNAYICTCKCFFRIEMVTHIFVLYFLIT